MQSTARAVLRRPLAHSRRVVSAFTQRPGVLRRRRWFGETARCLSAAAAAATPAPQHPGVRQLGDPALLKASVDVSSSELGSPEFLAQVERMETVMREAQGAGIAMCQVEGLPNLVSLWSERSLLRLQRRLGL